MYKGSNLEHYGGVPCTRIAKVSLVPKTYVEHVGLITFNIGTDIQTPLIDDLHPHPYLRQLSRKPLPISLLTSSLVLIPPCDYIFVVSMRIY